MKKLMILGIVLVLAVNCFADSLSHTLLGSTLTTVGRGRGLLLNPAWDATGTKLAWCNYYTGEILYCDLRNPNEVITLASGQVDAISSITWSVNGDYILFTKVGISPHILAKVKVTTKEIFDVLYPEDIVGVSEIRDPVIIASKLYFATDIGIYSVEIVEGENGPLVVEGTAKSLVRGMYRRPAVSQDGCNLLFEKEISPSQTQIWLVTAINALTTPIEDLNNSNNCYRVDNSDTFKFSPKFSQDASMFFYIEGAIDIEVIMAGGDDFCSNILKTKIAYSDKIKIGDFNATKELNLYHQWTSIAISPGGNRVAGTVIGGVEFNSGYGCSLDGGSALLVGSFAILFTADMTGEGLNVIEQPRTFQDGSGTIVTSVANTVVDGEVGTCHFVMYTPVSPFESLQEIGILETPPVRSFAPENTSFDPPLEVTIPITPVELSGSSTEDYEVVYLPEVGEKSLNLETLEVIDRGDNWIKVKVPHFSEITLIRSSMLIKDSDRDGLSDEDEVLYGTDPLNPDTDGDGLGDGRELNIFDTDPLNPDTDGDGMSDGDEVTWRYDPLDPISFGQLPLSPITLLVVILAVFGLGIRRMRFV